MDNFSSRVNDESQNMMKSRENFQQLEGKLKLVISKCNKNNLIDSDTDMYKYDVKNATRVDHYLIEEGLHVYKFYNGTQPIDYWISSRPVREKYEFVGHDSKKHTNDRYTGASCFEYSCGGIGNSTPVNGIDNYSVSSFVSTLIPSLSGGYLVNDLVATSGYGLSDSNSALGFHKYNSLVSSFYKSGDLFGYIRNSKKLITFEEDLRVLEELQGVIDKIDQLSLNKEKDAQNKKGFLKNLLGLNKELDSKIDAFGKKKGR